MPPHCDSLDGPVVVAARAALEQQDVEMILPYVHADGERELREAFDLALASRTLGSPAREVSDRWFFETAVRIHRSGEGAPFTGLKPAGLDVGPAVPAAEQAIASGSAAELAETLCGIVRTQAEERHARVIALKAHAGTSVDAARTYVQASLGLQVWAHGVYEQATAAPHAGAHEHG
jgi:hypothetical protein